MLLLTVIFLGWFIFVAAFVVDLLQISKHFPQCYMENNDKGCIPTTSNKNHDLFLAKKNILHDGFSPPPGVVHETLFDTIST